MGRKGKDLFQLLQLRERGNLPAPKKAPKTRATSAGGGEGDGLWARVKAAVPSVPAGGRGAGKGGRKGSSGRGAGGAAGAAFQLSGPALAGVAFGCLVVGFLAGRWLAPAPEAPDLSVGSLRTPSEQGLGDAGRNWGPEREEEELSNRVFALVSFSASDRHLAAELAVQLREAGFPGARIRRIESSASGGVNWITLVYTDDVPGEATEILRDRLLTVQLDNTYFNQSRADTVGWPIAFEF